MNTRANTRRLVAGLLAACGCLAGSAASAALVTFEGFSDGALLVNEVAGVSISGGTVLSAGIGLNELDFPPNSGVNVLAALSGPLSFDFGVPMAASAYIVVSEQLSVNAFDPLGQLLATFNAPFASNLGVPALFDFSWAGASRYALVSAQGFVIDDLRFDAGPLEVPEPSSLALTAIAVSGLGWALRRRPRARGQAAASR